VAAQKRYKALNFDLDTKKLKVVFGEKSYTRGYHEIERFLKANGFEHKQWSGYASVKPMSYSEIFITVERLVEKCPWFADCMNKFDATNIMSESDMYRAIKLMGAKQAADEEDVEKDDFDVDLI
jgi:cell filamentation protein